MINNLDLIIAVVRDEDVSSVHFSCRVAAAATERHVAVFTV